MVLQLAVDILDLSLSSLMPVDEDSNVILLVPKVVQNHGQRIVVTMVVELIDVVEIRI